MRTLASVLLFVFFYFTLAACNNTGGGGGGFVPTGSILVVAEKAGSEQTIKVGGLPGAAPSGSAVKVTDLDTGQTQFTTANPDGSFDPTFVGNTDASFHIVVTKDGEVIEDTVIGVTLLSDSVEENLAKLGSVPADIVIRGDKAYVVNGFSNNVQVFDLNQSPPKETDEKITLPPGSNPISMAFLDDTHAYVVNNIGQSVALETEKDNKWQCETLIVRTGEGGTTEPCQKVNFVPENAFEDPVGIAITKGKVFITNNNLDANFNPMGNGFITVINVLNNQFAGIIQASGVNTTSMVVIGSTLYALNNGAVLYDDKTNEFECDFDFPPSIDLINTQTNAVFSNIAIPLSPENPTVCLPNPLVVTPDGRFGYMGLGLVGGLLKVDLISGEVINGTDNPIVLTELDSLNLTADVAIQNNLLFATLFDTDQIAVVDTDTDEVNPFPYIAPFPAGIKAFDPGSKFFDGVQSLAIRPGEPGVDFQGPNIFFITGISEQLGSVDTTLGLSQ
jgi:hypothetical protein